MRKIFELCKVFYRRQGLSTLLFSILMPLVMILMVVFTGGGGKSADQLTAVLNLDQGELGQSFIGAYDGADSLMKIGDLSTGQALLESKKINQLLVLGADFSQTVLQGKVPQIDIYTADPELAGNQPLQMFLQDQIRNRVTNQTFVEAGLPEMSRSNHWKTHMKEPEVSSKSKTMIIFVCFGILYGSALLASDLVMMRQQQVLRRGLASPTSGVKILFSTMLASWSLQFASNALGIFLISRFYPFTPRNLGIFYAMAAALCFFSTGFQIFLLRIFRDPKAATGVGMFSAIFIMYLAIFGEMKTFLTSLPDLVFKLAYISPIYWVIQAFDGGNPFISGVIILLLGLCFFVAGSLKLRDFAA